MDRCIEDAKKQPHPTIPGKTAWQAFEEKRPFLMAYRAPFDGFHASEASVSKTCLQAAPTVLPGNYILNFKYAQRDTINTGPTIALSITTHYKYMQHTGKHAYITLFTCLQCCTDRRTGL